MFDTMEAIKIKMLNGGYTVKSLCIELNANHLLVKELNRYCTDNHGIFILGVHFNILFCILNCCQTVSFGSKQYKLLGFAYRLFDSRECFFIYFFFSTEGKI